MNDDHEHHSLIADRVMMVGNLLFHAGREQQGYGQRGPE